MAAHGSVAGDAVELVPLDAEIRLGAYLRTQRDHKGWSQADLAAALADLNLPNFTAAIIADMESGKRKMTFAEGLTIGRVLSIDTNTILQLNEPRLVEYSVQQACQRLTDDLDHLAESFRQVSEGKDQLLLLLGSDMPPRLRDQAEELLLRVIQEIAVLADVHGHVKTDTRGAVEAMIEQAARVRGQKRGSLRNPQAEPEPDLLVPPLVSPLPDPSELG